MRCIRAFCHVAMLETSACISDLEETAWVFARICSCCAGVMASKR